MDNDAVEPVEEPPPEAFAPCGAPRQQVVCGEDRRLAGPKQDGVKFGGREPLQVEYVPLTRKEAHCSERMFERAQGEPQRTRADPSRERIEAVAQPVAVRSRPLAEAESRGHEFDIDARAREGRRELMVVGGRERRWVYKSDVHRRKVDRVPHLDPVAHAAARALFPALGRIAYLNAGTFGPLARPVAAAMVAETQRDLEEGRSGGPYFERALVLREQLRERLGALVGVGAERVALTASTTDGCNIVLSGLGLGPEDEIVTTREEHTGLLLPLGASGARIVAVAADPEAIAAAVTPRTRLIAVSQVLWTTGRVLPVRELRAATGVPVLVDGAQSVGAIPVSAEGIDYLTVSGQKWLCGPDTTGALVVADPESLRVAWPTWFSQLGYGSGITLKPRAGAGRFDPNWWPVGSLAGLVAALDVRPAWWYEHARTVAARCRALLSQRFEVVEHPDQATLVAFRPGGDTAAIVRALFDQAVHVREIPGAGLVRVSCGWWTNDDDLDRLVAGLA